jgi:hypothetical protein
MTTAQKIAELMQLADSYAHVYAFVGDDTMPRRREALKQAIEAALKPGEPIGWSITCNGNHTGNFYQSSEVAEVRLIEANRKYPKDVRTIEPLFAAPPAQTPPRRLTDYQISVIAVDNPPDVHIYGRAIETAVRKQFGVNDE